MNPFLRVIAGKDPRTLQASLLLFQNDSAPPLRRGKEACGTPAAGVREMPHLLQPPALCPEQEVLRTFPDVATVPTTPRGNQRRTPLPKRLGP